MTADSSPNLNNFRLSELNKKISSSTPIWLFTIIIFLGAAFFYLFPQVLHGSINLPPQTGDGPDYDSLAVQLSKGNGFTFNWDDPEFLSPYIAHNESGKFNYLFDRHEIAVTTYRPPLFPVLMAISYRVFGRIFWPIRVFTSLCMALACTIFVIILTRWFGVIPGALGILLLFIAPELDYYASVIMTEALACLVVSMMSWALLRTIENRNWKTVASLGIITGIGFLTRSVFILWAPVIGAAVLILARPKSASWFCWSSLFLPALFLASFLIVSGPWMVRNCIVLQDFEPLGTMGSVNLSAGYSDRAFEKRGLWFNLNKEGFFDQLERDASIPWEKIMADYSKQEAAKWIFRNPLQVLLLVLFKVKGLWAPYGPKYIPCYVLAILGFLYLYTLRPREALGLLTLLAACTLAVGVTWFHYGRFLVPVIPILAMLASLGLWSLILASTEQVIEKLDICRRSDAPRK